MAQKDLVNLKTRSKEFLIGIGKKGGASRSEKKRKACAITGQSQAKCKRCKVKCFMKEIMLKKDPEATCILPMARYKALRQHCAILNWDDDILKGNMMTLMDLYQKYCQDQLEYHSTIKDSDEVDDETKEKIKRQSIKMMDTFFSRLKEFKEMYEPVIQKSINVNVNTNFDKMAERLEAFKKKEKDENLIIIKEDKDGK